MKYLFKYLDKREISIDKKEFIEMFKRLKNVISNIVSKLKKEPTAQNKECRKKHTLFFCQRSE